MWREWRDGSSEVYTVGSPMAGPAQSRSALHLGVTTDRLVLALRAGLKAQPKKYTLLQLVSQTQQGAHLID
jgi:hypothetical protein